MYYTNLQYSLMKQAENGLRWVFFAGHDEEDAALRFLIDENLISSNAQIADNFFQLTESGKALLNEHRIRISEAEKQRRENEMRETTRLKERHEDHAREEHYHAAQNKLAVKQLHLTAIIAVGTFILGIVTEHFTSICKWFLSLFS